MKGHTVTRGELLDVLAGLGCEVRRSKSGGDVATIAGIEVRIPGNRPADVVPKEVQTRVARACGVTQKELIEVYLGRTIANAGRSKKALPAVPALGAPSKHELLSLVHDLRASANRVEDSVRSTFGEGELGPEATKRALKLRSDLLTALDRIRVPASLSGDGWEQPDDTGYEPRRYDPVLTGVARATGDTARLAVRGTSATKGQLEEREAR